MANTETEPGRFDEIDHEILFYDGNLINNGEEYSFVNNISEICCSAAEGKMRSKSKGRSWPATSALASRSSVRGQWTVEEDSLLVKLVKEHGVRKWSQIAKKLVGRIGKQCRERWHNHLRPGIKKETWSEDEEILLMEAHKEVGNRWAEIAKKIPGRSENSIKNHWNATKRRLSSAKRKSCRRKTSKSCCNPSSFLQQYINYIQTTAADQILAADKPPSPSPSLNYKQQAVIATTSSTTTTTLQQAESSSYFCGDSSSSFMEEFDNFLSAASPPQLNELLGNSDNWLENWGGGGGGGGYDNEMGYLSAGKKDMDLIEMILSCSSRDYYSYSIC